MSTLIPVTLGICAYNEVANIEKAIRSVYEQVLDGFELREVIVVSSGSTDGTDDVVRRMAKEHGGLMLIRQETREGKASALNCFLDSKATELVAILNADTVFCDPGSLQELLKPLTDEKAGIVGGHPIPTNDKKTIAGFASHMIWTMHHYVSMVQPKIGEIIAFRDIGARLPANTNVDEDTLKMVIESSGYKSIYAPEAKVYNKGPENISDLVKQRTRVNIGQRHTKKKYDFDIPTWNTRILLSAYVKAMRELGFRPVKLIVFTGVELFSRLKAHLHVRSGKEDIPVWEPVGTTKKL